MKREIRRSPMLQWIFLFAGTVCIVIFSAVTSCYWHGNLVTFLDTLSHLRFRDLHISLSLKTVQMMLFLLALYGFAIAIYMSSRKNYRHGEEHGSTRWGNAAALGKKYGQKEKRKEGVHSNLILTQHMKISTNAQKIQRNLNVLVIGGAGAGKSMYYARPNLLQANTGYIVLDPKGELTEDCGSFLREEGYTVWVLDLKHPEQSDGYNPFEFLETQDDVLQLVDNLFDNTTDADARKGEQIWDDSAKALLRSLIFYVQEECPKEKQCFATVMEYLRKAKTQEDVMGNPQVSELDAAMDALANKQITQGRNPDRSPAWRSYQEYRSGAAKTMQSVLFTLNARLSKFNITSISNLTRHNTIDLKRVGREKIVIFAVIPDDTKAYNFLVGMLYTQLFQQLYRTADHYPGKKLPVPVHFLMDEFANVALPKDFESLLSTMRQRQIFCSIILQNLSQLKALYEKQWESIVGNCDSFLYLGGNEQSTFEYVSKRLGTETINLDTYSQSKGRNGSFSKQMQLQKRELMLPDEVGRLDNAYAIYIMRGENPVLDKKYDVFHHPNISRIALGGGKPYRYGEEKQEQAKRKKEQEEREMLIQAVEHVLTAASDGDMPIFDLSGIENNACTPGQLVAYAALELREQRKEENK